MGTDTAALTQKGSANSPSDTAVGTEHRSVTVLMVDIVGSTQLMENLGHESYAAALRGFHSMCTSIVRQHGGMVSEYLGDGVLCFFGLPKASEDDAAHGVAAGLEIINTLQRKRTDDALIEARLGLSSGSVMISVDADQFGTGAVGTCVHLAARLEAMAAPNTLMICDNTRRLIGRTFQLTDRGVHEMQGVSKPQPVYQVVKARRGLTTRFDALRGHLRGDLVGRQAELNALRAVFDKAGREGGCAVTISADAGLGKSRLIQSFLQSSEVVDGPSFVLQCTPEHSDTTLYPIVRYLEWVAGLNSNDDAIVRLKKLERLFEKAWGLDSGDREILLDIINRSDDNKAPDPSNSVVVRRARALEILADQLFASVVGRGTLVVVFEDVHWLDPTSAQLLDILLARASAHPVMIVLSTRDQPPYGDGLAMAPVLRLSALSKVDARILAEQILGKNAAIDLLIEKSEGVPLILQEYAEILSGKAAQDLENLEVPLSLTSVIQSKLDGLDRETLNFARAGSALGRSFDPKLVCRLIGLDAGKVDSIGRSLADLRLTHQIVDLKDDEEISFVHALIRDAVYGNMPNGERRIIHDAIANEYISQSATPPLEDHVLAGHLAKANRGEEAAELFLAAALTATKKGAALEALAHLEAGLDSIEALAPSEKRDHLELRLLAVRGPTLMVTRGPGNKEFGLTQTRAMELVERLDMLEEMLPVVFYTAEHAWAVADLDRAERMADAILMLDQQSPSDVAHLAGNLLKGMVAWHRGDNALATESFDRVMARYDMENHKSLYAYFIKEFGVFSQFYGALAKTIQGAPDDGLALAEGAMRLSKELNFPHEIGFALLARFNTALFRDDVVTTERASHEALRFSMEHGFPEFVAMAQFAQGWCQARRGDIAEGVAMMETGFGAWKQTGFTCWQGLFAAFLSPYLVKLGRIVEAGNLVNKHFEMINMTGENQCKAPLLLAQAIVERESGQAAKAITTAGFARSVALAQGAILWSNWIDAEFPPLNTG